MKITKISLTNFRAFKQSQTIEFAPVTLLFGPNSVGKSTVLKALFYVQQILSKGQCNPMYLDALNKKYIGGFENLVHKRDLDTNITLKIEYDKGDAIGSSYVHLADILGDVIDLQMGSPIIDANNIAIEFEISWSKFEKTAYIKTYKIWFDEILIAEVSSTSGSKQAFITTLNYAHELLQPHNQAEWIQSVKEMGGEIHPFLNSIESKEYDKRVGKLIEIQVEDFDELKEYSLFSLSESAFLSQFHELLNTDVDGSLSDNMMLMDNGYVATHQPISIGILQGALPKLGQKLKTTLELEDPKLTEVVNEILSDVIVAPLDNLLSILNQSLCIGPIRKIIDANYQPLPYVEQSDWYDGSAAWSNLLKTDISDLQKINSWMLDEDKLNLGYGLTMKLQSNIVKFKKLDEVVNSTNLFAELYEDTEKDNVAIDTFLGMFEKVLKGGMTSKALVKLAFSFTNKDYSRFESNIAAIKDAGDDFVEYFLSNLNLIKDFRKLKQSKPNDLKHNISVLLSRTNELLKRKIILDNDQRMLNKLRKYLEDYLDNSELSLVELDHQVTILMEDFGVYKRESLRTQSITYSIWDFDNNIPVLPNEIGTGVSQLMPLIVAAITQKGGLVACEQPELHLHPRVQVAIGDLLSQNTDSVSYLIETHSEHLILRLLKRIRQNTDNELPIGLKAFTKEEIAINYLEPSTDGVKVKKIRVDGDGEFKDRWPHGFFSERRDELM